MFKVPNQFRITEGQLGSDNSIGKQGAFSIPYNDTSSPRFLVICADGMGWEHVSISAHNTNEQRCPTWDEMCFIKNLFWDEEDCVIQFHPPKSEYVNRSIYVLHLWRESGKNLQTPPKFLV